MLDITVASVSTAVRVSVSSRPLQHKPESSRHSTSPGSIRTYAMAGSAALITRPNCVRRLPKATRTCRPVAWCSKRPITLSPRRLTQCIWVFTQLVWWSPLHVFPMLRPSRLQACTASLRRRAPEERDFQVCACLRAGLTA